MTGEAAHEVVLYTDLAGLTLHRRGKVRDVYQVGDDLLIVATDRISAYDVVLPTGIPDKGRILNQLSLYWFEETRSLVANHVITGECLAYPPLLEPYRRLLDQRSMLVRRTQPLPVECVARGYLYGSGWTEYQKTGSLSGIQLPAGLVEASRLPEPIFTPSTKEESGHDRNISEKEAGELVGRELSKRIKALALSLYRHAAAAAEPKGILLADTKFEFGLTGSGELLLIDEILTPDSSRFWPRADYRPGRQQPSFDKQFVRDYLSSLGWDKTPPAPELPAHVVEGTRDRYHQALVALTGRTL
jgi:phosphoribosylaminoimidazole-succinocarboxamide synthase